MSNWSGLLHDLLVLIARRLNLIEDYLNFGTVCKSWHSAATKQNFNSDLPRVPWLMLAEEFEGEKYRKPCVVLWEEQFEGDKYRPFLSLYNGMILKKRIPKASEKRFIMESMGWLITVGRRNRHVSLLHPFSGVDIELPQCEGDDMGDPVKAVLSANPSHTSNYVLMVITRWERFLCFWRPGDSTWTRISQAEDDSSVGDVVYFNGHFYTINSWSGVKVYDVASFESHMVAQLPSYPCGPRYLQFYILESLGSLFVVVRDIQQRWIITHGHEDLIDGTVNFEVFQINLTDGKATVTRELGDRAFFLGANASLSVHASQFSGVKPNHIYFTDDLSLWDPFSELNSGGLDNGVFNLADGSIQYYNEVTLLNFKYDVGCLCPPPTWVTPTLY